MKKVTIIAAALLVLLALAGCGLSTDPVVGTWQGSLSQKEFKSDGTMSTTVASVAVLGTWSHSGDSLTQTVGAASTTDTVTFSSDKNTMVIGAVLGASFTRM
jgi:uncharacterized lipoprotein NlpE involved in copper resistance